MTLPCISVSLVFTNGSPAVLSFFFSAALSMFFCLRFLVPAVVFHASFLGLRFPSRFPYFVLLLSPLTGGCVPFLLSGVFLVSLLLLRIASIFRRGFPSLHLLVLSLSLQWFTGFVLPAASFLTVLPSTFAAFLLGRIFPLAFRYRIPCPFCHLSAFVVCLLRIWSCKLCSSVSFHVPFLRGFPSSITLCFPSFCLLFRTPYRYMQLSFLLATLGVFTVACCFVCLPCGSFA